MFSQFQLFPSLKSSLASMNSSQYKFGVLARIVRHMRSRHQEGDTHALTLHQILDETNQLNVGAKIKQVCCSYNVLNLCHSLPATF